MLISEKQHQANCQNAQHSTGPTSEAGKAAVRYNALSWGLRARALMAKRDQGQDYQILWNGLAEEWQPETSCERHHLETMATSQWLLGRMAESDTEVYDSGMGLKAKIALLDRISVQRVRLERSFIGATNQLRQFKQDRLARAAAQAKAEAQSEAKAQAEAKAQTQAHPSEPAKPETAKPAHPPAPAQTAPAQPAPPHPDYVMSGDAPVHPLSCEPNPTDTR